MRTGCQQTNIIALKKDGTFLCSCKLLESRGLVCAHFFATLEYSKTARFHISLVNPRWYHDETSIEQVESEPMLTASGELEDKTIAPLLINALKDIRGNSIEHQTTTKRNKVKQYAEIWGKCREATQLSCELQDNRLLKYIDQLLIDLRKKKDDCITTTSQEHQYSDSSEDMSNNNNFSEQNPSEKENVNPNYNILDNPPAIATKGRPRKRRIPNEGLSRNQFSAKKKQKGSRHCRSCNETGHDLRNCPNKMK